MKCSILLPALAVLGLSIPVVCAEARLVADLNRAPGDSNADVGWMMRTPGGVVFSMSSLAHGQELWTSNGTPKGTKLLKDIEPGSLGSYHDLPVAAGGRIFFRVLTPAGGMELWVTDGTEVGTVLVTTAGPAGGVGTEMAGTDDGVFFYRTGLETPVFGELWFSDGSEEGTRLLNPLNDAGTARVGFEEPYILLSQGGWCYFIANDDELWRSDGTHAGTTMLLKEPFVSPFASPLMAVAGDTLYLAVTPNGSAAELWTAGLDGQNVAKVSPGDSEDWSRVWGMSALAGRIITVGNGAAERAVLWTSDGSADGTRNIPLSHAGKSGYQPVYSGGVAWKGIHYFIAWHPEEGHGLWRTDGTVEGTRLVRDMVPGAGGELHYLHAGESFLYFRAKVANGRWEQWRTDGTTAGTRRVAKLIDADEYGDMSEVAESRGALYFASGPDPAGIALWKTRANGRGVQRLTVPEKRTGSSYGQMTSNGVPYANAGGNFLSFVRDPRGRGSELWKIGAKGRATAVWRSPVDPGFSEESAFRETLGTKAIFTVISFPVKQVWVTDGSARGTRLLSNAPGYLGQFVASGGKVFYTVGSMDTGLYSLWVTDGTPAGTVPIVATSEMMSDAEMVDFKGTLYFLTATGDGKTGLWKSDGTEAGTVMVTDAWGEAGRAQARRLTVIGERLSITVNHPPTQVLWTSDGTKAGTVRVQNVPGENLLLEIGMSFDMDGVEMLVGRGSAESASYQWWRSNGTEAGTYPVVPGADWANVDLWPEAAAAIGGRIYYAGYSNPQNAEEEPWVTDGTPAGTRKLADIGEGLESSYPSQFTALGDVVYFTATDAAHGMELWKTDGTEEGTVLASDIEPGPLGSSPQDLKVIDGKLYFHADRPAIGRELYVVE